MSSIKSCDCATNLRLCAGSREAKKGHSGASKVLLKGFHKLFATMNTSHAELINSLRQTERLTDKTADAMLQVDRKYFLDPDNVEALHLAYQASCPRPFNPSLPEIYSIAFSCHLVCTNRITLFQ